MVFRHEQVGRRDLIRSSLVLGAALALRERARGAKTRMYLSLNGSLTGGKVGWPEFARLAAKTGYVGADVTAGARYRARSDAQSRRRLNRVTFGWATPRPGLS
jgi:hypothetical protein